MVPLNDLEWKQVLLYQDGINEHNLDSLRRFVSKKKEFKL